MKPDKMEERLKRLAESMEDLPIEGTTRIACMHCNATLHPNR